MTNVLEGINWYLYYEEETLVTAFEVSFYLSFTVMILILIQFFVGSYFNKMIGLETIQVVQFVYFIRILLK